MSAAFGAPIPNFGGGGVLKNPAAAARPARRRALLLIFLIPDYTQIQGLVVALCAVKYLFYVDGLLM